MLSSPADGEGEGAHDGALGDLLDAARRADAAARRRRTRSLLAQARGERRLADALHRLALDRQPVTVGLVDGTVRSGVVVAVRRELVVLLGFATAEWVALPLRAVASVVVAAPMAGGSPVGGSGPCPVEGPASTRWRSPVVVDATVGAVADLLAVLAEERAPLVLRPLGGDEHRGTIGSISEGLVEVASEPPCWLALRWLAEVRGGADPGAVRSHGEGQSSASALSPLPTTSG
jgi:hypothetical protein